MENGAVVHDGDAVGQSHGFTSIVGDVEGGELPIVVKLSKRVLKCESQFGVEVVEGFIEQEYSGTFDERATDGETLQLSAGDL